MPGVFLLLMIIIPFFPSKYLYLLLPSLISLHWLGLLVQCWICMVRRDVLALFLTLVWEYLSSDYEVWCFTCISFQMLYMKLERRQWHPTPVLLPGKSHGRRRLVGFSPWGREESDTTEQLHFHFLLSRIGGGNGNSLQCSCLENPRDRSLVGCHLWGRTESDTTEVT